MDASQFKKLFLPHSGLLYRTALRLTGSQQAAEDLVQDTFLRLWVRRDDLPDKLMPAGYALTVMRHIFYDRMRERRTQEIDKPADAMTLASDMDVQRQVAEADMGEKARLLIARLPDKQRQVMTMRDIEGLDTSQITEMTGLSEVNIRTLLCRARATIRQQFKSLMNHGCKKQ